jgi:hypothetical protein
MLFAAASNGGAKVANSLRGVMKVTVEMLTPPSNRRLPSATGTPMHRIVGSFSSLSMAYPRDRMASSSRCRSPRSVMVVAVR